MTAYDGNVGSDGDGALARTQVPPPALPSTPYPPYTTAKCRHMDELSEEERELEEMDNSIRIRGFKAIVLIGCVKTQQEEKQEASKREGRS
ncbi:uncharacterized protein ARMOST_20246 [Armillaria ostoyae]|uniref:Uncharacterized protein n=1 Tax=Armillaria ostoyae TaxID=47428 RepID=A0A284S6S5_ARMOS|nr:uncharacterized protein ARMOST_20246 [Armillaria ostoyae]